MAYYFVSHEEFQRMIDAGELLEHAEYAGNYYGTPYGPLREQAENGVDVILDIEVQGARQVMDKLPDAVSVFIAPPSMEVLEERLRGRSTESEEKIRIRLETAGVELALASMYDYVVVNDEVERAANELLGILNSDIPE